jgi:hypothetical protein
MHNVLENIRTRLRKRHLLLLAILGVYLALHVVGLSRQEFNGDEASPILLIDRMWDAFRLHDLRFLAYPFLFYSDPYRSFFSGTLLHILGPNRIVLRLPNILFDFITVIVLWLIMEKQRFPVWLNALILLCYTVSGISIIDRGAGGDGFMRLNFFLAAYFLWQAMEQKKLVLFRRSIVTWSLALLTMLDAIVLVPALILSFIRLHAAKHRATLLLTIGVVLFFAVYFSLWLYLPYRAYMSGFQQHYINRGLFYYFTRVNGGVTYNPLESPLALIHYSSLLMLGWFAFAALYQFRVKQFPFLRLMNLSIWIFVTLLRNPSFHIMMFFPVLTLHAAIYTQAFLKRWPRTALGIALFFIAVVIANAGQLFSAYGQAFFPTAPQRGTNDCLAESVKRIYASHHASPLPDACSRQIIE